MGQVWQGTELVSPQNKLKGILHSIFRKHDGLDQQVASESHVCSPNGSEHVPAGAAAVSQNDHEGESNCFSPTVHLRPSTSGHEPSCRVQLQLKSSSSKQHAAGLPISTSPVPSGTSDSASKPTLDVAALTATAAAPGEAAVFDSVRENVLSDTGMPHTAQPQAAAAAADASSDVTHEYGQPTLPLPIGQRSSNGSIKEPGASVWLHEAYVSHSTASSPAHGMPHSSNAAGFRAGKLCASVDDLYNVIFGDSAPSAASSSSAGGSPCPTGPGPTRQGSVVSMGSVGNLQYCSSSAYNNGPGPHITAESLAEQRQQGVGSSSGSGIHMNITSGASQSSTVCSSTTGYTQLDDLGVPAGLAKLKISSRKSGSDGSGSGFFMEESPTCSSSAGMVPPAWPPAAAASAAGRGSPRYGHPYGSSGVFSTASGGGSPLQQQQQQAMNAGGATPQKRLWDRRQQAALFDGCSSSGSRSAASSPRRGASADIVAGNGSSSGPVHTVGGVWRTHSSPAGASLAELAARLGAGSSSSNHCRSGHGGGSPAATGTPYSVSSCCTTPLAHSHSNPDIISCGMNSNGPGAPPACARALFGSVPQMDRPLGSSSWLARAESGLIDDHLSVASDDEFIREINSENVLSSAWGPAHTKLLSFKYCVATSPLNHPGRASPFKGSPFTSPRGSIRDGSMSDLLPLRSAVAASSCPGSPLANYASSSADDVAAAAAAAQQRHRHPFGRCSHEPSGSYRPSPLQHKQQRGYQDGPQEPGQQQDWLQQQTSSSGELPSSGHVSPDCEQTQGAEDEGTTVNQAVCSTSESACVADCSDALSACTGSEGLLFQQNDSGSAVRFSMPEHQQAAAAAATASAAETFKAGAVAAAAVVAAVVDEQQQVSSSRSERRPGNRPRGPAAAVGALLAGWGRAAEAIIADGQHVAPAAAAAPAAAVTAAPGSGKQPRYGIKQKARGAAGSSKSSSSSSPGSIEAAAGGRCSMLRVSGSTNSIMQDVSTGLGRSRSMPMGVVGSSSTTSSVAGAPRGGTIATCTSTPGGIMGQLSSSSSKGYAGGVPLLCSASSCEIQALKLQPADSPGQKGKLRRQHSSRLSSSSVGNPSRLSQSSAAGETAAAAADAVSAAARRSNSHSSGSLGMLEQQSSNRGPRSSSASSVPPPDDSSITTSSSSSSRGVTCRQQLELQPSITAAAGDDISDQVPSQSLEDVSACILASRAASNFSLTGVDNEEEDSGIEASDLALSWAGSSSPTGRQRSSITESQQHQAAMPSLPEVDFIERIGRGSFGDVYRGVWCGSVVAVKVIRVRQQVPARRMRAAARPAVLTTSVVTAGWDAGAAPVLPCSAAAGGASDQRSSSGSVAGGDANQQQQQQQQQQADEEHDEHEQQVAMELAQHEYESWLNANLRHPNIVQLFTSFTVVLEDRGPAAVGASLVREHGTATAAGMWGAGLSWKTHLVMEYCELGTMQAVLQRGLFMDPHAPTCCNQLWVLATAKELCVAIAYLHSMDVVHGDLKSSNVLLKAAATTAWDSRGFVAKVSDFGLSRVMDAISAANGTTASSTATSTYGEAAAGAVNASSGAPIGQWPCQPHFGALSHAAPELVRGEELSKASDVYSVGVLLWELVTGQAPFYGMHPGQLLNAKLTHPTSTLLAFPDTAPPGIVRLCLDCWLEDPSLRPMMPAVVDRLNWMAVELLGEDQAVMAFPDIVRALSAQRRSVAVAASAAGGSSFC